jgi:hypothetical protein
MRIPSELEALLRDAISDLSGVHGKQMQKDEAHCGWVKCPCSRAMLLRRLSAALRGEMEKQGVKFAPED